MIQETAKRYVKKISVNPEMSHNKILARMKENSTVLEFGSASGAMTKVLKNEMGCEVYIAEIDKECYEEIIPYVDGGICGDIEELEWAEKLEDKKFDYIIFADILEHLKRPEKVLTMAKKLLKQEGSVLLSVPNIAHNSILLQLFQNRFIYQSTGLLDYSHIRHFTYSEIVNLCKETGFSVIYMDGVYIGVGKNEFDVSYRDVSPELAEILKKRPFGELYQHILEIKDKDYVEKNKIKIENRLGEVKEYIPLLEEAELEKEQEEKTENEKIIEILSKNPNKFFSSNEEIARLRLEINEIYNTHPELEQVVRMRNRIYSCEEEIRQKNLHIWELNSQQGEKNKRIDELQKEVEERNKHIQRLDEEIGENRKKITEYKKEIEREIQIREVKDVANKIEDLLKEMKDNYESKLQNEIEKKDTQINDLREKAEKRNIQINDLEKQIEKKDIEIGLLENDIRLELEIKKKIEEEMQIIRQIKEETCATLEQEQIKLSEAAKQYKQEKVQLEQLIKNKEGHIELLLESDRELERIKHSKSWKLMGVSWKIAAFLAPPNSKRRLFGKLCVKGIIHPIRSLQLIFTPRKLRNFFYYLKKDGVGFVSARVDESMLGIKIEQPEYIVEKLEQKEQKDINSYEHLTFQEEQNPIVSIIIPVYNQFSYTYECLKSILKNSRDIAYEIILANDCSTDLTQQILKIVSNITVITNSENLRFLKNCNHAAKSARGTYLFFLNNDTQVQENWLKPLVDLIESTEGIGMVGSKLVYADGRLQEAGGILWKDGSAWNYGNRSDSSAPEYNYVKQADYISGAAIMINRRLWEEIGGFDERFIPAYCEDSDLAFEVRRRGYKVMYQPLSVIVHFEGVSNGIDTNSGQKAYQIVNQQKFKDKWRDILEKEHFPNAEHVFLARDRSKEGPILLMIDHYVPQYDKDAGSKTVFQYLSVFVKMGFQVKFIGDNFYKHEPYTTCLQQMGIEVLYGTYYANNWKKWIKENGQYFDYIFLNRPHISVKYIDYIKENTKAKIIYYGHDLHFLREQRKYELTHDKKALLDSKDWKETELSLMRKTDIVYYPSSIEIEEIKKVDPSIHAKALIAYMFENIKEIPYQIENREGIMFVGGFTHTPNIDAVLWLAQEILPEVKKKMPDIRFTILGSNPPEEILRLNGENIIIKGFVAEEELEHCYKTNRIAIVPLRYGAGIKGKVVEAMKFGVPVITTSVGAEGILGIENILCVEDDAKKMAEKIVTLYQDEKGLQEMSKNSYAYIKENFSVQKAWSVIKDDFSERKRKIRE